MINSLNKKEITSDVGYDGPSLPILSIRIKDNRTNKFESFILLDKEQADELVKLLQRNLAEM